LQSLISFQLSLFTFDTHLCYSHRSAKEKKREREREERGERREFSGNFYPHFYLSLSLSLPSILPSFSDRFRIVFALLYCILPPLLQQKREGKKSVEKGCSFSCCDGVFLEDAQHLPIASGHLLPHLSYYRLFLLHRAEEEGKDISQKEAKRCSFLLLLSALTQH
jgi:hypothetical protein